MSSMQPINEVPAEAGAAKPLSTARIVMLVQGGLAILGFILVALGSMAAANRLTDAEREEIRRNAERASGAGRLLGLVIFLLYIAVLVGLFVLAGRVRRGSPKARTWALVTEGTIVAMGLYSLIANFSPVGAVFVAIFNLALPAWVISLLMSAEAKRAVSAMGAADQANRFDVRNMPTLS